MSSTAPTQTASPSIEPAASASSLSSPEDGSTSVEATTTSNVPVQVTNAFSLAACLVVVVAYFVLRRRSKRIMERPSLVLAVSMAIADGLLHTINIFGYTDLPHNFICAFFGGFLYAFPTLISIFYSFCIALNTQLVFVFGKRPGSRSLKYYVGIPVALSACICIPALGSSVYGYDAVYDLCWIASDGTQSSQVLVRYLFTFGLWCLGAMAYLVVAAVTIIHSVFSKSSKMNKLASGLSKSLSKGSAGPRPQDGNSNFVVTRDAATGMPISRPLSMYNPQPATSNVSLTPLKSEFEADPPTPVAAQSRFGIRSKGAVSGASVYYSGSGQNSNSNSQPKPNAKSPRNETLSRRTLAMRALAFRLLGYILIPTICILPGVILDLITKVSPDAAANIPDSLSTGFDTLNGFVGLFNAILFAVDPALLALYHQMKIARLEKKAQKTDRHPPGQDLEMGETRMGETIYSTPPESPTLDTPMDMSFSHQQQKSPLDAKTGSNRSIEEMDLGDGTKVEVRAGKFLSPLLIGGRTKKKERALPSPRTPSLAAGIMIHVEVECDGDQDQELARLERYLGGL